MDEMASLMAEVKREVWFLSIFYKIESDQTSDIMFYSRLRFYLNLKFREFFNNLCYMCVAGEGLWFG